MDASLPNIVVPFHPPLYEKLMVQTLGRYRSALNRVPFDKLPPSRQAIVTGLHLRALEMFRSGYLWYGKFDLRTYDLSTGKENPLLGPSQRPRGIFSTVSDECIQKVSKWATDSNDDGTELAKLDYGNEDDFHCFKFIFYNSVFTWNQSGIEGPIPETLIRKIQAANEAH